MQKNALRDGSKVVVQRQDLQLLFDALVRKGYRVVGPTVRDGAIVYDELASVDDLPKGWTDRQGPGTYRLEKRADGALFGYAVGPHSWKKFLYPPQTRLWQARREGKSFEILPGGEPPPKYAFLGVRSCELHAIEIQDKVFLAGTHVDPGYQARRENAFIIAVHCGHIDSAAGNACFCVSMNTGPKAASGFDLALAEVLDGEAHYFVAEAGTEAGAEVLSAIAHAPAREAQVEAAEAAVARTAANMGRKMDTEGIKDLLERNLEHPRWNDVASRCLSCANCTMACPTCFCSTVEDTTDLSGDHAERWRKWDSCFTMDFSYIHGGAIRSSTLSRYRQWMTHKLSSWIGQFGSSGCVGCGRCIVWCPVGIDLTQEVQAIRETGNAKNHSNSAKEK